MHSCTNLFLLFISVAHAFHPSSVSIPTHTTCSSDVCVSSCDLRLTPPTALLSNTPTPGHTHSHYGNGVYHSLLMTLPDVYASTVEIVWLPWVRRYTEAHNVQSRAVWKVGMCGNCSMCHQTVAVPVFLSPEAETLCESVSSEAHSSSLSVPGVLRDKPKHSPQAAEQCKINKLWQDCKMETEVYGFVQAFFFSFFFKEPI